MHQPEDQKPARSEEADAAETTTAEAEAGGAAGEGHPKLGDIWHLVLLRGFLALALVLAVFIPNDALLSILGLLFGGVLVVGGLLELLMGHQLPGHPFRGILIFTGLTSMLIGAFLLYYYPANMALLVVTTGLWVALRGFAALWLGLSIVSGTFDRLLPAGAGLAALILGASAMIWLNPPSNVYANLVAVYALGAGLIQIVVAFRLRNRGRQAAGLQD